MNTLTIYFASSNEKKFLEIEKILDKEKENLYIDKICKRKQNFKIRFFKTTLKEIQSESIIEVAEDKVRKAFDIIKKPVIIEDDGLFIEALNGFPGVYSSFVFRTIGNKGIIDLLKDNNKRRAKFLSIISFHDGKTVESFIGETIGHITTEIFPGGWGYDPIFRPEEKDKTYGQIDILEKNKLSHRSKSFKRFLEWYNK